MLHDPHDRSKQIRYTKRQHSWRPCIHQLSSSLSKSTMPRYCRLSSRINCWPMRPQTLRYPPFPDVRLALPVFGLTSREQQHLCDGLRIPRDIAQTCILHMQRNFVAILCQYVIFKALPGRVTKGSVSVFENFLTCAVRHSTGSQYPRSVCSTPFSCNSCHTQHAERLLCQVTGAPVASGATDNPVSIAVSHWLC